MVFSFMSKEPTAEELMVGRDYDVDPTKLYGLIEKREWKQVVVHATKCPVEAATWIYRKEKDDPTKLRWKQLPLHAAIIFGCNEAVAHALLRSYPEAAESQDDQGMLPVHLAFRHDAAEATIDMLLKVYPEGANLRDRKGRIPITMVRFGTKTSNLLRVAPRPPSTTSSSPNEPNNPNNPTVSGVVSFEKTNDGKAAITNMRSYMASFIMERSSVVAAQHMETKMKEMMDAYSEEIATLHSEKERNEQHEWDLLRTLEKELLEANALFRTWGSHDRSTDSIENNNDDDPDNLKFHSKDFLNRDEMHSSLIFTIHRFAEKTKAIQDQKQLELQKAAEGHGLALKMLKEKHDNEIAQLKQLLEGRIAEATKHLTQTEEEKDRVEQSSRNELNTLAEQLQQRMATYEEQQRILEETQKTNKEQASRLLQLETEALEKEKTHVEIRQTYTDQIAALQGELNDREYRITDQSQQLEELAEARGEVQTLQSKVENLLQTMSEVQHKSRQELEKSDVDKQRLQEEAKYSDEALKQASETVQTLEEQLAKTYVEKEELKSRYYGLQQSSKSLQDVQQQTIENLESEVDNNRRLLEMQTHQIAELTDKFEGLTALRNKELEVAKGRETLLTAKMENLNIKYESFREEIDEYQKRFQLSEQELADQADQIQTLQRHLEEERTSNRTLEEDLRAAKESEAIHSDRVHDLAEKLAKISMERKRLGDHMEAAKARMEAENGVHTQRLQTQIKELESKVKETERHVNVFDRRCKELENENLSLRVSLEETAKKLIRSNADETRERQTITKHKLSLENENKQLHKSITDMSAELENIAKNIYS